MGNIESEVQNNNKSERIKKPFWDRSERPNDPDYNFMRKNTIELWGEFSEEEQATLKLWTEKLKIDLLAETPFCDADFMRAFQENIPAEEQFTYVENTNNFQMEYGGWKQEEKEKYDPAYVLVTRRAVPSDTPKPEMYWTYEHRTARIGLRNEIPLGSAQRAYSVIMVSTLQKLLDHGLYHKQGGVSDGEIAINPEPFDPKDMLFTYKPEFEKYDMYGFDKTKEEVLEELKQAALQRAESKRII